MTRLTQDNAAQIERCKQLQTLVNERIHAWELSIAQKQEGKAVDLRALLNQNLELSARNAAVTEAIRAEENSLLAPRIHVAQRSFVITSLIVGVTFVVALAFLSVYYGLLNQQLRARESAERQAREAFDRESTARREAEDFRLFIGAVRDYAIFTLDASGHIKNWNEGAPEWLRCFRNHWPAFLPFLFRGGHSERQAAKGTGGCRARRKS